MILIGLLLFVAACDDKASIPKEPEISMGDVIEKHRDTATNKLRKLVAVAESVGDKESLTDDTLGPLDDAPLLCLNQKYAGLNPKQRKRWKDCNAEVLYVQTLLTMSPDNDPSLPDNDPQEHVYLGDDGLTRVHQMLTRGKVTNRYDPEQTGDYDWNVVHHTIAQAYFTRFMGLRYFFLVRPRESSGLAKFRADIFLYDAKDDEFLGGFPVVEKGELTFYKYIDDDSLAYSKNTVIKVAHEIIAGTIEEHYPSKEGTRGLAWLNTIGRLQH